MPKDQEWFEMKALRKKRLDEAVWIPLRAAEMQKTGEFGQLGRLNEFYGVGSVAVPIGARDQAKDWNWEELNLMHDHRGFTREDGIYIPADSYDGLPGGVKAVRLAIAQRGNSQEPPEWHLHQDFVVTLDLKRENDTWVAINEDYREAAKLKRRDGRPVLLEANAEFLKDYLCARGMALRVSSYRSREEIVVDAGHIDWPTNFVRTVLDEGRWEGRKTDIHAGGDIFGAKAAVVHMGMTNVDYDVDVPRIDESDEAQTSRYWETESTGEKLRKIEGELWRDEWVEPGERSPRIRYDDPATLISFIVDASGSRLADQELAASNGWLWFRPEIITGLTDRRGGDLRWYTRDTGGVRASPGTTHLHFGVNELGLINFYAEDIARLPQWIQQICFGFNITPEGGVSKELLMSQMEGKPASTRSAEQLFAESMIGLNEISQAKLGFGLLRKHDQSAKLLNRITRFRSLEQSSFFALAKDIARLTADSINASELQKIVTPSKGEKWGSLKSLEQFLAKHVDAAEAHAMLGPLFGIYDLRLSDAHLPKSNIDEDLARVKIDPCLPFVTQGYQLIKTCVETIDAIIAIIERLPDEQ